VKRSPVLRFLRDKGRLRAHFDSAGLDGSQPLPSLLEALARVARAEQRRLEPTPLDQAGEARAALEQVRRRLGSKTESELAAVADGTGVHVRTLYRIRAGQPSTRRTTLERLARELDVPFDGVAFEPPGLTDVDDEIAAAAQREATREWAREQKAKVLAGEPPTALDLGELGRGLSPDAVQTWRSQHPERWPEPPYSPARVRLWEHRAAHGRT
jgi:transcriptional regulator with XRE-family HTH domain